MRDEDFDFFIEKFGEATSSIEVNKTSIEKWTGVLPDVLLNYWRLEGWASYKNGLFSLVDPDIYEDILDFWLEGTSLDENDAYHVIAQNGFGGLYVFGEKTGRNITISPCNSRIIFNKNKSKRKSPEVLAWDIKGLIGSVKPEMIDLEDERGVGIFDRAVKLLGPLNYDEIFGFDTALALGGGSNLKNIKKVDCQIYLRILREIYPPTIFEI